MTKTIIQTFQVILDKLRKYLVDSNIKFGNTRQELN